MNATDEIKRARKIDVRLGADEYRLVIKERGELDSVNVMVEKYNHAITSFECYTYVLDESFYERTDDLDSIRHAFRGVWGKLKRWTSGRQELLSAAREQTTRGKKAHFTKLANQNLKYIHQYAAQWKLCKQLWKEITKL